MLEIPVTKFPRLTTRRLALRRLLKRDAPRILALYGAPEVMAYHTSKPYTSLREAFELIDFHADLFRRGGGIRWVMAEPETDRLIGSCGYHDWSHRRACAEISYELDSAYWRQGLMSEALRAILDYGFATMELKTIRARVLADNSASLRLLRKFGFIDTGEGKLVRGWLGDQRDLRWYALSRETSDIS